MAVPTNTALTYAGVVNREDLSDIVYRISPTTTPLLSGAAKTKATAVKHEWTTDVLATAAANAVLEGDDTTAIAIAAGTRVDNYCQISKKSARISGTQQAVNTAGNLYQMSTQMAKRMAELKRDMEFGLTQNSSYVAGNASTARQTRGLEGWIATNNDLGASGVAPSGNTAATDGTARAFTEAQIKNVIQLCYTQGGMPDTIMVGPSQKQTFSTFTGSATQMGDADDKKLVATIDFYVSDFGTLKVVPNLFQRSRTAFILEMEKWAVAYLRTFSTTDLAKTGDSDAKQIIVEYCLESRNEAASGAVRDLS